MSIQLTIELRNADVLRSFAAWWDAQAPGDVGTEEPVPYTVAEQEQLIASLPDLPPVEEPARNTVAVVNTTPATQPTAETASVHRTDGRPADRPGSKEPAPASKAIVTPTLDEFTKAVKVWFQADAATRGPKVKAALDALGIAKLAEVPVDKFAAVLTDLGVS